MDDLTDSEQEEEEVEPERPGVDYEALDPTTGFKKVEWQIWQAYTEAILDKPEDEREQDEDEWADTFSQDNEIERNRLTVVMKLGIYAGARDDFNQRTGEGKAIYANGDVYEGQYWEGKKNGKGKYLHKSLGMSEVDKLLSTSWSARPEDQSVEEFIPVVVQAFQVGPEVVRVALDYGFYPCYNGDYVNNLRHGQGVMKNRDASVYKGYWKDNKRHGEGIFYYLNGDTYMGEWAEGLKHGAGQYTFVGGKGEYVGEWEKGVFKQGQWKMTDQIYYEGKYDQKNRPCDPEGSIKFPPLGMVQTGDYQKGKWCPTNDLLRITDLANADEVEAAEAQDLVPAAAPVVA